MSRTDPQNSCRPSSSTTILAAHGSPHPPVAGGGDAHLERRVFTRCQSRVAVVDHRQVVRMEQVPRRQADELRPGAVPSIRVDAGET